METAICIYCKKEKSIDQFNREHVVPLALGAFINNPFILNNVVCWECNDYFGKNLDLILGRGSFEGLVRISQGIKGFKRTTGNRIEIQYPLKGDFEGAYMLLVGYQGEEVFEVELLPQVAFKKEREGKKVFFTLDRIPSKEELEKEGFNIKQLWVYGDQKGMEQVTAVLKKKGINYILQETKPMSEVDEQILLKKVPIKAIIDNINFRAVAKIAFNYMAYFENRDFILNNDFDNIRNYVRYGSPVPRIPIQMKDTPLLLSDTSSYPQTEGHLITLEWKNGGPILAKVKPFNLITYKITLCDNFHGVYRPIHVGHHFDIHSGIISELTVLRHIKPPY